MNTLCRNILLFIVSFILARLILLYCFVITNIVLLVQWRIAELADYYFYCALTNDQAGNVYCQYQLDWIMTTGGVHFGNPDETISSRLGKLKKAGKLSKFGKMISGLLNKIDPNHVEKSIETDEL